MRTIADVGNKCGIYVACSIGTILFSVDSLLR